MRAMPKKRAWIVGLLTSAAMLAPIGMAGPAGAAKLLPKDRPAHVVPVAANATDAAPTPVPATPAPTDPQAQPPAADQAPAPSDAAPAPTTEGAQPTQPAPNAPSPDQATPAQPAPAPSGQAAAPDQPTAQTAGAQGVLAPDAVNSAQFDPKAETDKKPNAVVLKAEILLDRADSSPGVMDGIFGSNVEKAVKAFQTTHDLKPDGKLGQDLWNALGADHAAPLLVSYTITPQDVAGPFTPNLPTDYAELAKLPQIGYQDVAEMLAERFHMDEGFLKALNPGRDFNKAGTQIVVAAVKRQPITRKLKRIDVDKSVGQVRAYDDQDKLIVAYPATIGSPELPSPSGTHKVKGVSWHPIYYYDPDKNFKQGNNTEKLKLPAGPNNPVGVVFIALTKPTYGIHGTPDPAKIDKASSHGCVRLTNWDALELAHAVKFGLTVRFIGKD
ncbi:Lipoprotein-anchoring transpeptidase ErfK/SrfK [Faunimonas pinastri]|uniref:Lipoprotein-anchoring transpeptidase ErfK/SrfK n=1 Tax=Faunimonas pinastri TaxID=1855383 RepID=A0A1H9LAD6_9HYPH|nr:L,D-transpeptidase [Faunimonas pinastri]SER08406.1 Lipoprotein-anchoring transpeptidase ErfK/SrfK [Faunimonas pinastri]